MHISKILVLLYETNFSEINASIVDLTYSTSTTNSAIKLHSLQAMKK